MTSIAIGARWLLSSTRWAVTMISPRPLSFSGLAGGTAAPLGEFASGVLCGTGAALVLRLSRQRPDQRRPGYAEEKLSAHLHPPRFPIIPETMEFLFLSSRIISAQMRRADCTRCLGPRI